MVIWDDDTIEYFKKKNKPGCEGDYIRAITEFVHHNCYNRFPKIGELDYDTLIKDLIAKTKR